MDFISPKLKSQIWVVLVMLSANLAFFHWSPNLQFTSIIRDKLGFDTNCKNLNPLDLDLTLIIACKSTGIMNKFKHEDYLEWRWCIHNSLFDLIRGRDEVAKFALYLNETTNTHTHTLCVCVCVCVWLGEGMSLLCQKNDGLNLPIIAKLIHKAHVISYQTYE